MGSLGNLVVMALLVLQALSERGGRTQGPSQKRLFSNAGVLGEQVGREEEVDQVNRAERVATAATADIWYCAAKLRSLDWRFSLRR
ncbi:hypothetical protein [Rhizobium ruizarguesonis]|uniref:hypothetical protein n=1 Tax=Rhizobium ruizarguesonis TaxID=2081791 RepID=UPI0014484750|nr:hypothetical protein [Rhizobium ruizarguesonis]